MRRVMLYDTLNRPECNYCSESIIAVSTLEIIEPRRQVVWWGAVVVGDAWWLRVCSMHVLMITLPPHGSL